MPGTSLLSMLRRMKSGAQARAGLYISKKAVLAVTGPAGASFFGAVSVLASVVAGACEQAARTKAARAAAVVASGFLITHFPIHGTRMHGKWRSPVAHPFRQRTGFLRYKRQRTRIK